MPAPRAAFGTRRLSLTETQSPPSRPGPAVAENRSPWPSRQPVQQNRVLSIQNEPITPSDCLDSSPKFSPSTLLGVAKNLCKALKTYSDLLSEPTVDHAAEACRVLHSSMTAFLPSSSTRPASPTPNQRNNGVVTGKESSTFYDYWNLDTSRSSIQSSIELHHAEELENILSPFYLFACGEVLAANLEHIDCRLNGRVSPFASLTGLYRLAQVQIKNTNETLCVQLVRMGSVSLPLSPNDSESRLREGPDVNHTLKGDGSTLGGVLDTLHAMIDVKCQLIELQSLLFRGTTFNPSNSSKELTHAANTSGLLLESFLAMIPQGMDGYGPIQALLSNFVRDLKSWKYCFETCASLERCE